MKKMKRIRIPKTVKIGGRVYKVNERYRFLETKLWGQADHSLCEIRLSDIDEGGGKRDRQTVEETFLHEVIHSICSVYCNSEKVGEEEVAGIARGLYQVIKDNRIFI